MILNQKSSFTDVEKLSGFILALWDTVELVVHESHNQEPELNRLNSKRFHRKTKSINSWDLSFENGILTLFRTKTNATIWKTDFQRILYSRELRQFDTHIATDSVYGLGERVDSFRKTSFNYTRYTFMNRDRVPTENSNLYGSHPTYLSIESDGKAHQALMHNWYPGEAILRPGPAITWRFLGGKIHFLITIQPDPIKAIESYNQMVGLPFLPPVWSFGFQLCRWGYNSLNETRAAYQRMRSAGIPFDVQWNDIDYMNSFDDFTYDPVAFAGLPDFVQELHEKNMRYIPMIDPGLNGIFLNGNKYDGFTNDVVIRNLDGSPVRGKVWNTNWTAWVDFASPQGQQFWSDMLVSFHQQIPFDGLWIDMNDPSNEVDGSLDGCTANALDNPPYLPGDDLNPIYKKTVCMSAKHGNNIDHIAVHNIYANLEAKTTARYINLIFSY